MSGVSYLELLKLAAPETIVVLTVLAVLAADLWRCAGWTCASGVVIGAMIACAGCVAAIAWMLALPQQANFAEGMLVVDPLTQFVKVALLVLTVFTLFISMDADFTRTRASTSR